MIKYRFALDINDNLIDVQSLERIHLTKADKFYSLDYRQELIPRLGKQKRKHFAHKPNIVGLGSKETYLHSLGKKVFYEENKSCLDGNKPFYLPYTINSFCNRLQGEFNINCHLKTETAKFNLTQYFNEIREEKKDGNYIPDLLLINTNTNKKIYIEIAVTHFSSETKKQTGHRIIEFHLENEDDIDKLMNFKTGESNYIAKYYNFKEENKIAESCSEGNCIRDFKLFNVGINGKCNLHIAGENDIRKILKSYKSDTILQIVEPFKQFHEGDDTFGRNEGAEIFKYYMAFAHSNKIKVKNCYLCRYHSENTGWDFIEGEPVFCKFLKKTCKSNSATKCQYFRVENNYVEEYLNPPEDRYENGYSMY